MAITFPVSDVEPAREAPRVVPFADATAALGARDAVASSGPQQLVEGPAVNALVYAAHLAFAAHRPLVLAPDDVWFTVLHGVGQHVARDAEGLRARFVSHEGRAAIELRRDELHPAMDPPGDWSTAPAELCARVLERCGPVARALRAEFSTTDAPARAAMDVAVLDALESYFSYSVASLCGIPSVTLLGAPDDWASLLRRLDALADLGLDGWVSALREVLGEFHRASQGQVDREFWRALYKPEGFSGRDLVVGWINVFFPHLRDGPGPAPRELEAYLPRNLPAPVDYEASWLVFEEVLPPKPHELPVGLARAPFAWKLPGETRSMELVAGHVGVGHDAATGAVRPRFGWWVAPASEPRAFVVHNPSPRDCALSPRDPKTLRSLRTLAAESAGQATVGLSLSWCPELESLDGLGAVPSLASLSLLECNRVASLAPLAGLSALQRLFVSQCAGLRDVAALATLTGLRSLCLMRCPGVRARDLAAIRDLPELRELSLWGIEGLPARFAKQLTDPGEIRALQSWLREHAS